MLRCLDFGAISAPRAPVTSVTSADGAASKERSFGGSSALAQLSRLYDDEVYDRSIDVQILRLRRKIEANPSEPQFIKTAHGAGYIFSVPVEVLY